METRRIPVLCVPHSTQAAGNLKGYILVGGKTNIAEVWNVSRTWHKCIAALRIKEGSWVLGALLGSKIARL